MRHFLELPLLILTFVVRFSTPQEMTEDEMTTYTQFLADQKRLWDDLFKGYDPNLSAIYTSHKSEFLNQSKKIHHPPMMELKLTMAMLKLVDVVEVEEKVSFLFDYSSEWTDHRLKWDPYEYGGISHIYVPQKSIWLPEITIVDAQEVKFFESDDAPRTAWINYNGTVGFYTATVSSVICQLDVFKFPLDQHECGVSVLFHTYFPDEYRIKGGMVNIVKPLSELGNGEWKVTYVGVAEIPLSNDTIGSTTKFIARLERNPGFYISLVMIPAYCINFLTIIALFLKVENVMEKLNVGLTNIMAMTFILVILAADLPKTARIPLLAIYVIVGLGIVMSSIGMVLALPRIRKCLKKRNNNEEPKLQELPRLQKFWKWLKVEYIFMVVFQVANLVNFVILFV